MSTFAATLLADISRLARRAGEEILDVYRQPFDVERKKDASPLTQADLRAHAAIVKGLEALTPDTPVLSEEASEIGFDVRSQWWRYWLVDPLDGTREFVSRNGEFTVNIALIENHVPTLGVVHVPVKDTTYSGVHGEGAFRQSGSEATVRIRVQTPAASPLRVVGSRSHAGAGSLDAYLDRLGAHSLLSVGSSLKFCFVAEGSADFYPRFGPTSEWDTAAAHAVVAAAGGAVVDLQGQPLRYNTRDSLLNPHFLVFGDHNRDWIGALESAG
ncbi:MAG TPA: 3'(2'),5'-bisphosphate nucleotidase CysQ [Povalibacter sp.]|uniref:3'(2'),5'-bisphosphate nucleotidase CysQ n=1 Tax=Povalibacter sp. TaxID=1962978 RepID=UPI002CD956D0|nr:3'(2'),5'-bisphosphate nucleotidase CysQ [Povalibacter sp.]HMN47186.1 3'(2'),5'-bisphosphate nucleotidase CysQ [Povalibacter sp.]